MKNTLQSGNGTFQIEAPYKLIETGAKSAKKPLIVYLHGFNQNIGLFEKLIEPMFEVEAYHLLVQAPYPIYDRSRQKNVEEWGRSWYLYDGQQDQFVKSLERASEFLEERIKNIRKQIPASRTALLGYSMGGYLAGYYVLSRSDQVNELVVIGARIKTEVFSKGFNEVDHLNVLALHGSDDKSVKSGPQQKSCHTLSSWGASVTFKELNKTHRLNSVYLDETIAWLKTFDYKISGI